MQSQPQLTRGPCRSPLRPCRSPSFSSLHSLRPSRCVGPAASAVSSLQYGCALCGLGTTATTSSSRSDDFVQPPRRLRRFNLVTSARDAMLPLCALTHTIEPYSISYSAVISTPHNVEHYSISYRAVISIYLLAPSVPSVRLESRYSDINITY